MIVIDQNTSEKNYELMDNIWNLVVLHTYTRMNKILVLALIPAYLIFAPCFTLFGYSGFPILRQVILVVRVLCRVARKVSYPRYIARLHRKDSGQGFRSPVRSGTPARQL